MEQLKCPNCGSNLPKGSNVCDYCGARYIVEEDKPKPSKVEQVIVIENTSSKKSKISSQTLNTFLLQENPHHKNKIQNIMVTLFMLIWVGGCFGGGIFIASQSGSVFAAIVLFAMGIFGIFGMSSTVQASKVHLEKYLALMYENNRYEEAYQLLQRQIRRFPNSSQRENFLRQAILIAYYKLDIIEDVEPYINLLTEVEETPNAQIQKIAKALNIEYKSQIKTEEEIEKEELEDEEE